MPSTAPPMLKAPQAGLATCPLREQLTPTWGRGRPGRGGVSESNQFHCFCGPHRAPTLSRARWTNCSTEQSKGWLCADLCASVSPPALGLRGGELWVLPCPLLQLLVCDAVFGHQLVEHQDPNGHVYLRGRGGVGACMRTGQGFIGAQLCFPLPGQRRAPGKRQSHWSELCQPGPRSCPLHPTVSSSC